jgi:predicted adenylyl cyclase CyaB
MARNLELKARLVDLQAARATAARLSGGPPEVLEQVDTYFRCPRARLKLREAPGQTAHLIAYVRPDEAEAKASDYLIAPVADAAALRAALGAALGIWGEVRKRRELSLVENVRIHLDEVEGLGTFLEFEAVLSSPDDQRRAPGQLDRLAGEFGLGTSDLVPASYSDLLLPSWGTGDGLTAADTTGSSATPETTPRRRTG